MKNKVLVKIIIPELDDNYDVFLPVNEIIWKLKQLIVKSISDLSGGEIPLKIDYVLMNKDTGKVYDNNEILINTDIRNSTELLLISSTAFLNR